MANYGIEDFLRLIFIKIQGPGKCDKINSIDDSKLLNVITQQHHTYMAMY